MSFKSGLYLGHVVHARLRPRRHKLRYRVFSMLLDLDEAEALGRTHRLFGFNRRAIFSVWERDLGDRRGTGLRQWVETLAAQAGVEIDRPAIRVLCYPRLFGFVFNPLTIYYVMDAAEAVRVVIYEVTNTFHERRVYVLRPEAEGPVLEHSCEKEMYVSPFVPMACRYHFHIEVPGERVLVRIDETDPEGLLLRASFAGARQEISDTALFKALLAYPLMTLKVVAAIHWEALKLFLKRVPVIRHRAAPEQMAVTIVDAPQPPSARLREAARSTIG